MRVPSNDNCTLLEVLQLGPFADILRRHPLATPQARGFGRRQGQSRNVFQRGLDRKKTSRVDQTMPTLRYGIQRNRVRFAESSDGKTTQLGNVTHRSERNRK